jgi:hypothetical protein
MVIGIELCSYPLELLHHPIPLDSVIVVALSHRREVFWP